MRRASISPLRQSSLRLPSPAGRNHLGYSVKGMLPHSLMSLLGVSGLASFRNAAGGEGWVECGSTRGDGRLMSEKGEVKEDEEGLKNGPEEGKS
ncbi:hypothetical protein BT69DRAFT_1287708 [Atractiella rhizophila]|nr:hypothetical protein BT69DRAFT_1287708 [Atractiella rhizophila]